VLSAGPSGRDCCSKARAPPRRAEILEEISEPIKRRQRSVISASIGIGPSSPTRYRQRDPARNADAGRSIRSKESGKNCYRFFSSHNERRGLGTILLRSALRKALDEHEFVVHYQPMVDSKSGDLVRARSPRPLAEERPGLIGPDRFIRPCRGDRLTIELSEQVLLSACSQGRKWLDAGLDPGGSPSTSPAISSGGTIRRQDFRDNRGDGFPRGTSNRNHGSALLDDAPEILSRPPAAEGDGHFLRIDDFGTKYSSWPT